jgi:hypothetical protein
LLRSKRGSRAVARMSLNEAVFETAVQPNRMVATRVKVTSSTSGSARVARDDVHSHSRRLHGATVRAAHSEFDVDAVLANHTLPIASLCRSRPSNA